MVLYAYYGFLEYLRARLMVRIGRRVEETLRDRVFDMVTTHALRKTPGMGSQPVNDLATIRQYLSGQGPFAFFDMPWVPVYLGIIFLMHWVLGVASAVLRRSSFSRWPCFRSGRRATRCRKRPRRPSRRSIITDEGRRNAEALHALGMLGAVRARWAAVQQTALDHQTVANDAGGGLGAISRVLRLMIQSGILALGAYLAIKHEISSGTMIAASIIMSRALAPVEQAVANWQQFLGFRKARDRLTTLLKAMPPRRKPMQLPKPKGKLSVENLIVQMPGIEKPLLQGISFTAEPGEGVGVIGPTGAGKSTMARALVGIIPPTRGNVRLDGATLDQRDPDELGRMIGYLPQDVQLFDGTVMQNISRFDPQAQPEKVVEAAKLANVHDLIMRLARRLQHPARRKRLKAFGGPAAAHGAGESNVQRSRALRSRRAQFQSRCRRRAGARPCHPPRAVAGCVGYRHRASAERAGSHHQDGGFERRQGGGHGSAR